MRLRQRAASRPVAQLQGIWSADDRRESGLDDLGIGLVQGRNDGTAEARLIRINYRAAGGQCEPAGEEGQKKASKAGDAGPPKPLTGVSQPSRASFSATRGAK